mmetsp:Transcript_21667/g.35226  ORF Transcript_21667/g.35226 Transcript_21667/m.35226 type:complete len:243 (-) Transcript_21667:450-1178(-)
MNYRDFSQKALLLPDQLGSTLQLPLIFIDACHDIHHVEYFHLRRIFGNLTFVRTLGSHFRPIVHQILVRKIQRGQARRGPSLGPLNHPSNRGRFLHQSQGSKHRQSHLTLHVRVFPPQLILVALHQPLLLQLTCLLHPHRRVLGSLAAQSHLVRLDHVLRLQQQVGILPRRIAEASDALAPRTPGGVEQFPLRGHDLVAKATAVVHAQYFSGGCIHGLSSGQSIAEVGCLAGRLAEGGARDA